MPAGGPGSPVDRPSVELWLADVAALAQPLADLDACDPLLTADERADLAGPRRAARMALRLLLGRMFGRAAASSVFMSAGHGKPSLAGLQGDFNLAHSGTLALIGIATAGPIGVDLESARSVRLDTRRRDAIAAASIRLAGGIDLPAGEDARMLQAWARLEAYGKASGQGIGRTLVQLGIWGRPKDEAVPPGASDSLGLAVHDVDAGTGQHAAVALRAGVALPPLWHLPADASALSAIRNGAALPPNSGVDLRPGAGQKGPHRSVAQPG